MGLKHVDFRFGVNSVQLSLKSIIGLAPTVHVGTGCHDMLFHLDEHYSIGEEW